MLFFPVAALAADFKLSWDPNCNQNPYLEGYNIYFKEDASVVDDPSGAFEIYVDLSDPEFDSNEPGYIVADLLDDKRYCFAVTAWYGDREGDMSDEVCVINGAPYAEPAPSPPNPADSSTDDASSDNSSGGCFMMGTLK